MTLEHPAYGLLRPVTETASVLLCNNPGLLTLEGTNTWVLRGPGSDQMVIVDPGPEDDEHIAKVTELGTIPLVLISHKHEGHTADSVSFLLDDALLTADTVLGRGTTVIDNEDGSLAEYMESLRRLHGLGHRTVLPGHGPDLDDLEAVSAMYLAHREERLDQVRDALHALGDDASARQIVEHVYTDVDEKLWDAAEWSVQAQLDYLRST